MSGWTWLIALTGFLVGGLGGVWFWWGLLGDRLQGGHHQRRCPRCWHAMEGLPNRRCPECGRETARESQLFRPRRRWRLVGGGVVLMVLGGAMVIAPVIAAAGLMTLAPDPVRAAVWPWATYEQGGERLLTDAHEGRLGPLSRRVLVWRARQVLRSDAKWSTKGFALTLLATQGKAAAAARDEVIAMMSDAAASNRGWAAVVLREARIDDPRAVAALIAMAKDEPDDPARSLVLRALHELAVPCVQASPAFLEAFRESDGQARSDAAAFLVESGSMGVAALAGEFLKSDADRRRDAAHALQRAEARHAAAAVDVLVTALRSPDWELRRDAATLAGEMAWSEGGGPVFAELVASLGDERPQVRRAATRALERCPPAFVPHLAEALNGASPAVLKPVCEILTRLSPAATAALPALASLAADSQRPEEVRMEAWMAYQSITAAAAEAARNPADGP